MFHALPSLICLPARSWAHLPPHTSAGCVLTGTIAAELGKHGVSLRQALFVHLYLADMAHFPAANAAFARHFPAVNPPARACVQACLPPGSPVAVDVLCRAAGAPAHVLLLPLTAHAAMAWHSTSFGVCLPADTQSEHSCRAVRPLRMALVSPLSHLSACKSQLSLLHSMARQQ